MKISRAFSLRDLLWLAAVLWVANGWYSWKVGFERIFREEQANFERNLTSQRPVIASQMGSTDEWDEKRLRSAIEGVARQEANLNHLREQIKECEEREQIQMSKQR